MSKPYQIHEQISDEIRDALGDLPEFIKQLLGARGIVTREAADTFLNPDYDTHTNDPFLFRDMHKAVERVLLAIERGEKIAIYSDFDADGIPGGVILHDFFKRIGYSNFTNYIPHRDEEGYGFHAHAVEQLVQNGASLIITVDVGIADGEGTKRANELGTDVIITDHHLEQETLPEAFAIINPQCVGETYPYKNLCGAGVAYKLVQALLLHMREHGAPEDLSLPPEGWEKWLLDLVAIATVGDMVPLTEENRALVYWGLTVLRKSPRPGIVALCRQLRLQQHYLTEDDIGFAIAPRINASSRMGTPEDAFNLLASDSEEEAMALAKKLDSTNNKRKAAVAAIVRELKGRFDEDGHPVLVAGNPKWNPALLGLAANSLSEKYGKAVCLWGRDGTGALKGSCRGNGETHILKLFENASDSLAHYGGHEHAGGFTVIPEAVHDLPESFARAYVHAHTQNDAERHVDESLKLPDISLQTIDTLSHMSPFGIGNEKPIFVLEGVSVQSVREFGKESTHIELTLTHPNAPGTVRANKFFANAESFSRSLKKGIVVDILGTLEENKFGSRSAEIRIIDVF